MRGGGPRVPRARGEPARAPRDVPGYARRRARGRRERRAAADRLRSPAPTPRAAGAALPEFCMEDVANFVQNLVTGSPHFFLELQPTELDDLWT